MILAIGVGAGPARADADAATEAARRVACKHDALALCPFPALTRNRAGVRDCLVRNISKISDACRDVIKAAEATVRTTEK